MDVHAEAIAEDFRRTRSRTEEIFSLLAPEAYHERPISLRHPFVFYDGHLDAFNWNKLFREALGEAPFNPDFDALFARGIDPATEAQARRHGRESWPSRPAIQEYKAQVRERLFAFLETGRVSVLSGGLHEILLEHEVMHQETLLYMIHQLPAALKRAPEGFAEADDVPAPAPQMKDVPAGIAVLGAKEGEFPFGWDNEFPQHESQVPAFAIDAYNVTNGQYLDFVEAGGYQRREFWDEETWSWKKAHGIAHPVNWRQKDGDWVYRDLFGERLLPLSWPVIVSHAEARAYARFVGKALPSEAEWHRAAFGNQSDWPYPWGTAAPSAEHGNFDFSRWSPAPVGAYPKGASPLGVHDLVGNGWEWTSTVFGPFPGFQAEPAYPYYSADFFDGRHYVMKGASCFTDRRLLRRSFRNWFYGHYPYMYATFRCVAR